MRAIIILALIVLLMGLAGWLTFGSAPGKTSITIETDEIRRDTEDALEKTEEVIKSGARAISNDDNTVQEQPVAPSTASAELERHSRDTEPVTTTPTETPVTSPVTP